jgi:hypothetical protein
MNAWICFAAQIVFRFHAVQAWHNGVCYFGRGVRDGYTESIRNFNSCAVCPSIQMPSILPRENEDDWQVLQHFHLETSSTGTTSFYDTIAFVPGYRRLAWRLVRVGSGHTCFQVRNVCCLYGSICGELLVERNRGPFTSYWEIHTLAACCTSIEIIENYLHRCSECFFAVTEKAALQNIEVSWKPVERSSDWFALINVRVKYFLVVVIAAMALSPNSRGRYISVSSGAFSLVLFFVSQAPPSRPSWRWSKRSLYLTALLLYITGTGIHYQTCLFFVFLIGCSCLRHIMSHRIQIL